MSNDEQSILTNRRFLTLLENGFTEGCDIANPSEYLKTTCETLSTVAKQSNKLFALSAISFTCFCIKAIGLRIDLIFIDKKIFDTPYGIFVFCVASQILYILAMLRSNDAKFFERIVRSICQKYFHDELGLIHQSLIGSHSWVTPQMYASKHIKAGLFHDVLADISLSIAALATLALYALPAAAGTYFLLNFNELSGSSAIELQWWAVLSTTILSTLSFLLNASFNFLDMDE